MKRRYQKDKTIILRLLGLAKAPEPGAHAAWHYLTEEAYGRLKNGDGSKDDFDQIVVQLNCALIEAEKIRPEVVARIVAGQDAMARMRERYHKGLSLGFDAAGLRDVPIALDIWEQISSASPALHIRGLIKEAYRRETGKELRI